LIYYLDMKDKKVEYNPNKIEAHWQKVWEKEKTFSPDLKAAKKPFYNLMMFPYPSAEGLHVGNMYAFTGADIYGRYKRMQGNDVFEPIGLDGFGIHSENYALRVGRHPREQAEISEKNFYRQLRATGNAYDWTRTLETYDPDYYRWTQWIFVQMFKKGLAYRKKAQVNWCPSCKTVLADEQVIEGKCERCSSIVEKKDLEQWFFAITKYADRLLLGLDKIDWPEKIKIAQRLWIGKSEGARIEFVIASGAKQSQKETASSPSASRSDTIEVFTTRPDTLFGATFMVLSPEYPIVSSIKDKKVQDYVRAAKKRTERERIEEGKEKTGVFSGLYAINPVNHEKIPVWIAEYVLMAYGTGAIMAVPAHDQRDFEFAKKYGLPIKKVIVEPRFAGVIERHPEGVINVDEGVNGVNEAYEGEGVIINSSEWNGLKVPEEISKVVDWLQDTGIGKREAHYHLRDWLISRQRYWGPPIPMIFCSTCEKNGIGEHEDTPGWYSVTEDQLPVLLPDVEDWKPKGEGTSPLANHPEFHETKCPSCGSKARRETDVSDTFLDSAWYFFRYISTDDKTCIWDPERARKWLPVNMYIGGAEHSVLHLLYVRFITMAFKDWGLISHFEEPFPRFFAHGLLIKERAKMSKSRGNVVVPDEYIAKYGADALRLYLMFLGPFDHGGDFRDTGIEGMYRFVKRVWRLVTQGLSSKDQLSSINNQELERVMNRAIKEVSGDIENLRYNTAIAHIMEYVNALIDFHTKYKILDTKYCKSLLLLLAPFAPHMTEELWQRLAVSGLRIEETNQTKRQLPTAKSIHFEPWPQYDEKYLVEKEATIVIQVNGKRRGEIRIQSSESRIQSLVEGKARKEVEKYVEGKDVKNVIYIPGKIINFVV